MPDETDGHEVDKTQESRVPPLDREDQIQVIPWEIRGDMRLKLSLISAAVGAKILETFVEVLDDSVFPGEQLHPIDLPPNSVVRMENALVFESLFGHVGILP